MRAHLVTHWSSTAFARREGFGVAFLNERAARFLVGERGMELGLQFFQRNGGWVIALSRWTILLPELLSCYAGLMRMAPKQYFAALLCGTLPMSFTYAWLGSTETAQDNKLLALAISAAVPVFLWGGWSWWNKNKATNLPRETD